MVEMPDLRQRVVEDLQVVEMGEAPDLGADLADVPRDMSSDPVDMSPRDSGPDMEEQPSDLVDMMPDLVDLPAHCGELPLSCAAPVAPAVAHYIEPLEACEFALRLQQDEPLFQEFVAHIEAWRGGAVLLAALDFNRVASPKISASNADRLKNHDVFGFSWQGGDASSVDWYPQGITGTDDAYMERTGRPRQLMVSWYDKATGDLPERGVRISVVNLDGAITYRHILLVEPVRKADGSVDMVPLLTDAGVSLHGGGIVWLDDHLYVADTTHGIRVFDLRHIYQVDTAQQALQFDAQAVRGFGYRYVLPQRAMYRTVSDLGCTSKFSFLGLDRTQSPPMLSSGEYHKDDEQGRLLFWPVEQDAQGWLKEEVDGTVRATEAYVGAQSKMQGGLSIGDDIVISSSTQISSGHGRIYRTRPGAQSQITAWPKGAEDLYYERSTGRIWTPAEHPGTRDTVSIPYVPFVSP